MKLKLETSKKILSKARECIPTMTQTISKGPEVYGYEGVPHYATSARGVILSDVDGNQYIDYSLGLGSVLLGHADPHVNAVVKKYLDKGNSLSLMHPLEVSVSSEILDKICPWADMVRFGKSGSDVTSAAIRLARAITKRDYIAVATNYGFGSEYPYHGWHDWCAVLSNKKLGIPKAVANLTMTFDYNNPNSLDNLFKKKGKDIAAVILEGAKFSVPSSDFINHLNEINERYGALLIVDEIANGLRLSPGGAHQRFGIHPDLVTYGKSFGNGIPLSILVGTKEYMKKFEKIEFGMTYGGETLGLAAAKEVLKIYYERKVFEYIETVGGQLKTRLEHLVNLLGLEDQICVQGFPARFIVVPIGDTEGVIDKKRNLLLRKLLAQNGILCPGVHNISFSLKAHHVKKTIYAYEQAFKTLFDIKLSTKNSSILNGG